MDTFDKAHTALARGIDWGSVNNAHVVDRQAVVIGTALDAVSVVAQSGGDVEQAITDAKLYLFGKTPL